MPTTWPQIQKHMRDSYKLADDTPDMVSMVWTYEEGRAQKILLRRYRAAEQEMLEFKSAFARRSDAEPEDLLRDNASLPIATVALSGDVYLVVYNALLGNLSMKDLDFLLSRVAAVADRLEEKHAGEDRF
jgi:hypothetical protein